MRRVLCHSGVSSWPVSECADSLSFGGFRCAQCACGPGEPRLLPSNRCWVDQPWRKSTSPVSMAPKNQRLSITLSVQYRVHVVADGISSQRPLDRCVQTSRITLFTIGSLEDLILTFAAYVLFIMLCVRTVGLTRMQALGAQLSSAESQLFEWLVSKDHEHFKAVSALLKRPRPAPQMEFGTL